MECRGNHRAVRSLPRIESSDVSEQLAQDGGVGSADFRDALFQRDILTLVQTRYTQGGKTVFRIEGDFEDCSLQNLGFIEGDSFCRLPDVVPVVLSKVRDGGGRPKDFLHLFLGLLSYLQAQDVFRSGIVASVGDYSFASSKRQENRNQSACA